MFPLQKKHEKNCGNSPCFPYHRIPDAGQADDFLLREICSGDLLDDMQRGWISKKKTTEQDDVRERWWFSLTLKKQNPGMLMILFVANEKGRHLVMVKITTCTHNFNFHGVAYGCHTSERS